MAITASQREEFNITPSEETETEEEVSDAEVPFDVEEVDEETGEILTQE